VLIRSASDHSRYSEAMAVAERGGWAERVVTWQDVCAVLEGCVFDADRAERVRRFFGMLRHSKGQFAGHRFELLDWQWNGLVAPLFGWIRPDGSRRHRRGYVEIPKKNGKSTLGAGIALYLLAGDDEPGAEVYSAASDREQASIVYREAAAMVRASPSLAKRLRPIDSTKTVTYASRAARYHALSADAPRTEGLNIHGLIFDELHAQRQRALWDALIYGGASRRQPLMLSITTAGYDRNTVCWEEHELARQVLEGSVENTGYFAAIYAAGQEEDWTDPAVWRLANPSYGVTVFEDDFRQQCEEAQASPAKQNGFRRYRLNQWTEQDERWMDLAAWDACDGEVDEGALAGRFCYAGLDLSSTQDVTAFVMVFKGDDGVFRVVPRFWVPGASATEREHKHGVPYRAWAAQGLVTLIPGAVIDYGAVVRDIVELGERFDVRTIAYDRWGAAAVAQELTGAGFALAQTGQGFASMSAPTKELMHLVLDRRLAHGGNPVLRWMAGNMVVKQDPAGNLKPDKARSAQKIDGMVALVMAVDQCVRQEGPVEPVMEVW
jgi:phage terminase large subunit-like protein